MLDAVEKLDDPVLIGYYLHYGWDDKIDSDSWEDILSQNLRERMVGNYVGFAIRRFDPLWNEDSINVIAWVLVDEVIVSPEGDVSVFAEDEQYSVMKWSTIKIRYPNYEERYKDTYKEHFNN